MRNKTLNKEKTQTGLEALAGSRSTSPAKASSPADYLVKRDDNLQFLYFKQF